MRILHLVHQYLPEHVGGTELYTKWLTEALNRRGHQIFIFYRRSAAGAGLECRIEENRYIWAAWAGWLSPIRRFWATFDDPALARAFERVLDEAQPELIHIQHLLGFPTTIIQAIRRRGIPYVISLWDFWWICANAQLLTNYSQAVCDGPHLYLNCACCALARIQQPRLWPLLPALAGPLFWRNHLLRSIMKGANKLIAPTEFVHQWYASHGVPAEKLVTLTPGLEPAGSLTRPRRPTDDSIRFVYIGGLAWQKGVHVLVEAFSHLEDGAELWIVGDETAEPAYVTRLRTLASAKVRFLGKLARPEIWDTLAQVDVLVVPSLWYETFAFVISEAFAAGVPVVASRLGPLADRVRHGIDGLLVSPGEVSAWQETLRWFQQDPTLLPRLQAGIGPVQTIEDHVKEIEALYRSIQPAGSRRLEIA